MLQKYIVLSSNKRKKNKFSENKEKQFLSSSKFRQIFSLKRSNLMSQLLLKSSVIIYFLSMVAILLLLFFQFVVMPNFVLYKNIIVKI
jgi:hypothetical protein